MFTLTMRVLGSPTIPPKVSPELSFFRAKPKGRSIGVAAGEPMTFLGPLLMCDRFLLQAFVISFEQTGGKKLDLSDSSCFKRRCQGLHGGQGTMVV